MPNSRPKLLVFDLDYTLWPFWVDTHFNPPFSKKSQNKIVDCRGAKVTCYPEVPAVLRKLQDEGYILAVASRTGEIEGANQLIDLFGWEKYFKYKEIFPGSKVTHLTNIKRDSGVDFNEMMFFDDETRNIHDAHRIGVTAILVSTGVKQKIVDDALEKFSQDQ